MMFGTASRTGSGSTSYRWVRYERRGDWWVPSRKMREEGWIREDAGDKSPLSVGPSLGRVMKNVPRLGALMRSRMSGKISHDVVLPSHKQRSSLRRLLFTPYSSCNQLNIQ